MYDFDQVDGIVKALGDRAIAVVGPDGEHAALPITLHDLIEYIQESGACASRHLNAGDKQGEETGEN